MFGSSLFSADYDDSSEVRSLSGAMPGPTNRSHRLHVEVQVQTRETRMCPKDNPRSWTRKERNTLTVYRRKPRRRSTSSSSTSSDERPPPKIRRHSKSVRRTDQSRGDERREKKPNEVDKEDKQEVDIKQTKQDEVKRKVSELKSRSSGRRIPNPREAGASGPRIPTPLPAGSSTDRPQEVAGDEYSYSYDEEEEAIPTPPVGDVNIHFRQGNDAVETFFARPTRSVVPFSSRPPNDSFDKTGRES